MNAKDQPAPAPPNSALVLFSGGQDSTVCLVDALARRDYVETIGFAYGQRHAVELDARRAVIAGLRDQFSQLAARLGPDHELSLNEFGAISETALTRDVEIRMSASGLPSTFVPGRNIVFFTYAAAIAYRRGIGTLIGGMCETDFSGYPDCRHATLQALATALSLGLDAGVTIETPLMWVDKAATWALADKLGGEALVELIVSQTHTCYLGERGRRHAWGYGCGRCPACDLRARGWNAWQAGNCGGRTMPPPA